MSERSVRVMLVDDHPVVRVGLTALLETVPQFNLVGEAGSQAEAVAVARGCQPDVVVMDVRLPDGDGVEACRQIRAERPATRVLMLTSFPDEDAVVAAIVAGAAGYLVKQTDPDQLIRAIETVAAGGSLLDPAMTARALAWIRHPDSTATGDPMASLTVQEQKILALIAEGQTNREIAATLGLSEHTIKTYVSTLLQKLHVRRRAEAAAFIARRQRPRAP